MKESLLVQSNSKSEIHADFWVGNQKSILKVLEMVNKKYPKVAFLQFDCDRRNNPETRSLTSPS